MSSFDFYVHGTPKGHQTEGSEFSRDYISTFYNHDSHISEESVLQIDICGGNTFYTYLRRKGISDMEGRPNSFFAMTICFREAYCTNVYTLFQIFDAIYKQICVGSILKQSGGGEKFMVADLKSARKGSQSTLELILTNIKQQVDRLIAPTLQQFSGGNTYNQPKKTFSLQEVDSPLFFDNMKKYSIIVSPEIQPSAIAYDKVVSDLSQVTAQKNALSSSNSRLQAELSSLDQENKSLTAQLNASESSSKKKYQAKLDRLENDLRMATQERDTLKRKIEEASSSIELMDVPFKKLSRLMAGRFPENTPVKGGRAVESEPETPPMARRPLWRDWLNSILLVLVLACSCAILVLVLTGKDREDASLTINNDSVGEIPTGTEEQLAGDPSKPTETNSSKESGDSSTSTFDWSQCKVDIRRFNGSLKIGSSYTVSLKQGNKEAADAPYGEWDIKSDSGVDLNIYGGASFTVPDDLQPGSRVTIKYMYDGKSVVERTVYVKKTII